MLLPWRARAASGVTVLKAARLFDGRSMHSPGVLVVSADRIVSMHEGDTGSAAAVVEFGDATIMPGLIDCHTHIADLVLPSHYLTLTLGSTARPTTFRKRLFTAFVTHK
jgi:imidazolonepropionase-like amidohydrolase